MADDGRIEQYDLISKEAIESPGVLNKSVLDLIGTIKQLVEASKGLQANGGFGGGALPKAKDDIEKLTQAQKELVKIENQIATAVAKDSDEYRKLQVELNKVKDAAKQKNGVDEQTARNATALNSSITALGKALQKNQQDYANLRSEHERSSPVGKELLATIQKQDSAYKGLREEIGIHKDSVGAYREEIEKLIPGFKGVNSGIVEAGELVLSLGDRFKAVGKSIEAFFKGPYGVILVIVALVLTAIEVVKEAMSAYSKTTIEGIDKANRKLGEHEGLMAVVEDRLQHIGKVLKDNGVSFSYLADKAIVYTLILTKQYELLAEIADRQKVGIALAQLETEIRREEIKLTVENSKLVLEKDEQSFASRNKALLTDQRRYEAVKRLGEVSKEQSELALNAALKENEAARKAVELAGYKIKNGETAVDLLDQEAYQITGNYELVEKLAETEKKINEAKGVQFEGARRRQALEISLIDEKIKKLRDELKLRAESFQVLNTAEINADTEKNNRLIANQSSSIEKRLVAATANTKNILDLDAQAQVKDLQAAREHAFELVILDEATKRKIEEESKGSLERRAQLEIDAREKVIDKDIDFNQIQQNIISAHYEAQNDIIKKGAEEAVKITIDKLKQIADAEANSGVALQISKEQEALAKSYTAGEISLSKYNRIKAKLQREDVTNTLENNIESLQNVLDYYNSDEQLAEVHKNDIIKIEKEIADAKGKIATNAADKAAAIQTKLNEKLKQLSSAALSFITQFGDAQYEDHKKQYDDELNALGKKHDRELAMVGNNAEAKAKIENEFAIKSAKIKKEQKKVDHDKAIFDRDMAILKIAVNTAIAVGEAIAAFPITGGLPFSAIDAALGAIEIGAVLSQKIPSYDVGTDDHPGGLAKVHPGELMHVPGQGVQFTPNTVTIMDLPEHTKVMNNQDTMRALAMTGIRPNDSTQHNGYDFQNLEKKFDKLNSTMANKKEVHLNFSRAGIEALFVQAESREKFLGDFYY